MILAIDQGTTGTRAVLYDRRGKIRASAYREFTQYYPQPGLVEHDAEEIWRATRAVIGAAWKKARRPRIEAIGITNQRETTVLWDKRSGKPAAKAIVWQDRRTADVCRRLEKRGALREVRRKTGLVLDPYFSATKLRWLLDRSPARRGRAARGELLFGTIDSWLIWKLTGAAVHATDYSNASRTLLFDIGSKRWDPALCRLFGVPRACLPAARPSAAGFGATARGVLPAGIPIRAVMGDQQAALYGQGCWHPGTAKNTYGTGCFAVMNLGTRRKAPAKGLLMTLACDEKGAPVYALEGSVFIGGAAVQWLRDGLGFFARARESEALARSVPDAGGVMFVPALTGLGAPYWNPAARGLLAGLTRGTTRAHITRAVLEGVAHRCVDVLEPMAAASGRRLSLDVDGGAAANGLLMQTQADLLGRPVRVSPLGEATAWGVARLAGRGWLKASRARGGKTYRPRLSASARRAARARWRTLLALVCA